MTEIIEKKRGGLLTGWLIFMLVANGFSSLIYFFNAPAVVSSLSVPVEISWVYALGVLGLINFVMTIMLFQWKKWAFFGFCGVSVVAFFMNTFVFHVGISSSLMGFAGMIILYLIMRPKWSLFE